MADNFKKFLSVSSETSRLSRERFVLDRVSWKDVAGISNYADYDHVELNLTALAGMAGETAFIADIIASVFDPEAWVHILESRGSIFVVGDPSCSIQLENPEAALFDLPSPSNPRPDVPLMRVLNVEIDNRDLDYRRVVQSGRRNFERIYRYLDSVAKWPYSIKKLSLSDHLKLLVQQRKLQIGSFHTFGMTSYSTVLAVQIDFIDASGQRSGELTILPASLRGTDIDDLFVLQQCFGIATTLAEPQWVSALKVPEQTEIEDSIGEKRRERTEIDTEIVAKEQRLQACKRWYRLLYDDGHSLEAIVKESFELLGASVSKISNEKDDYRIKIRPYPEAVMEVKGTHNAKFGIGALRQLAGWMDEANARENITVKGIFIGNGGRTVEPQTRGKLFEKNSEDYAVIKEVVVLRSMDLFCLTILKLLTLLDVTKLWKEFYECKGSFDTTRHWAMLPPKFPLQATAKPEHDSKEQSSKPG